MVCGAQTCKGVILGVENFFQKVLHRLLHQYYTKKVLLYVETRTERRYQQVRIFGQEMTGF